jgi:hypothetical protein
LAQQALGEQADTFVPSNQRSPQEQAKLDDQERALDRVMHAVERIALRAVHKHEKSHHSGNEQAHE